MAHDVFISYSSRDKAVADAVCATLESRKVRCWIAPRDVPAGQTWAGALVEAIDASRVLVLVLSDGSNRSQQVLREVGEAVDKGIPILPFRIDNVQPSRDMGYYIRSIHWLDALTPPLEQHLGKLADQVQALLGQQVEPPEPPRPEPPKPRRPAWQWMLAALGVLAALALSGWGVVALVQGRGRAPEPTLTALAGPTAIATAPVAAAPTDTAQLPPAQGPTSMPTVLAAPTATAAPPAAPSPLPEAVSALRAVRGPVVPVDGYSIAWSPDGRTLLVGGTEVFVLDAEAGFEQVRSFASHTGDNRLALSPDGQTVALMDRGVKLYDLESGGELRTLYEDPGGRNAVCASFLAFSPDGAALAAVAGDAVRLFDVTGGQEISTFAAPEAISIAFARDGQSLFVGEASGAAAVDPATGERLYAIGNDTAPSYCLVLSPDGTLLATAGPTDGGISLIDAATGRLVRTLTGHEGGMTRLAFSADGRVLASAGNDLRIRLWDTATGAELASVTGHTQRPTALAFSPGGVLASADGYGKILLWTFEPAGESAEPEPRAASGPVPTLPALSEQAISPGNAAQVKLLQSRADSGYYVTWSRDGKALAAYGFQTSRGVSWVAVDTWKEVRTFAFGGSFSEIAVSPDGRLLALSGSGARLFEIESGAELYTLYETQISRGSTCGSFLSFSPDGAMLAVQEGDAVQLWDVATGTLADTLVAKGANSIAYAAGGRTVFAAGTYGLDALDVATGEATHLLGEAGSSLSCLAASADGTLLALSGWSSDSIILWDTAQGRQVRTWTLSGGRLSRIAFSPDGRVLATAGDDLKIRLWEVATGTELAALTGPTDDVAALAFSPDGATLVSAGRDRTVRLWGIGP